MHTNFESFKYCFIGKTGEGLTGSYERAMEHSHVHQYVLVLSHIFSPSFNGGLGNDVFWRLPWGHSQSTCDLILLSRAFCTSLTLCACLRMVAGAEARAGKVLVTHTHRLCCGGGVAEGQRENCTQAPFTCSLCNLRSGFLLVARFLAERTLLQLFHSHKSPQYSIKPVIFSHHSNMLYSLGFSYTHSSPGN